MGSDRHNEGQLCVYGGWTDALLKASANLFRLKWPILDILYLLIISLKLECGTFTYK